MWTEIVMAIAFSDAIDMCEWSLKLKLTYHEDFMLN